MIVCALFNAVLAAESPTAGAAPELFPSFPNHALKALPAEVISRANPAGAADVDLPFSWPQVAVMRSGTTIVRLLGGFDPGFQDVLFEVIPSIPQIVKVEEFSGQAGFITVTAPKKSMGLLETFLFQVRARNLSSDETYPLTFDIRDERARIRRAPLVSRSPGAFVKPGQIVCYHWTLTTRAEKRPKCEAEFVGKTGTARGLSASTLTEVLATKVQPFVIGHYLMTVTPRDVRGEPARGSTSNGVVFRCAFGSANLPPVTDGILADTFSPAVGQTLTLRPVAIDPETGQSVFDNQTYDFGDGSVLTGISGTTTHAYATPGIFSVRCTMADELSASATAADNILVGAEPITNLKFTSSKQLIPEEGGIGELKNDSLKVTFKNVGAGPEDRIVFVYNRNRYGRMNASEGGDGEDIVLKNGKFSSGERFTQHMTVSARGTSLSIALTAAQFDRTGDPRLGRSELKGIFKNQRIALCVIPADGSTPRVLAYTGNMQIKVKGGQSNRGSFIPEETIRSSATIKEPNPKKQENY